MAKESTIHPAHPTTYCVCFCNVGFTRAWALYGRLLSACDHISTCNSVFSCRHRLRSRLSPRGTLGHGSATLWGFYSITNARPNLHLALAPIARTLVGLDTNVRGLDVLRAHDDGAYFTRPSQIDRRFDALLVPEVVEHVANAGMFFAELDMLDLDIAMITAPNALIRPPNPWWNATYRRGDKLVQFAHPDDKCYYSLTSRNTVQSFSPVERDPRRHDRRRNVSPR